MRKKTYKRQSALSKAKTQLFAYERVIDEMTKTSQAMQARLAELHKERDEHANRADLANSRMIDLTGVVVGAYNNGMLDSVPALRTRAMSILGLRGRYYGDQTNAASPQAPDSERKH